MFWARLPAHDVPRKSRAKDKSSRAADNGEILHGLGRCKAHVLCRATPPFQCHTPSVILMVLSTIMGKPKVFP